MTYLDASLHIAGCGFVHVVMPSHHMHHKPTQTLSFVGFTVCILMSSVYQDSVKQHNLHLRTNVLPSV